jgi:multidrug efflux pump
VNQAKGSFDGPDQAWTINDNDQLQAGAQYGPIIIAYRNGAPVRIRDVATVIDGAENTKLAAWVNADRAIVLNIQRQPGTNIISVVDTVQGSFLKSKHLCRRGSACRSSPTVPPPSGHR